MITIRGPNGPVEFDVDIRAELEQFPWVSATWTDTKLIAASPFRYERHPSFAVILEHGGWRDYGAIDPEYETGGFVKLLAFLRDETYEETCDYLIATYGDRSDNDEIPLRLPKLKTEGPRTIRINPSILDGYRWRHPYLAGRGISEDVQRLMRIGYDRGRRAITIPWFNADGTLGNVKYRQVTGKTFWYESRARPVREMLYAIDVAYSSNIKRAVVVEAEIDAMTLMTAGIFAIATGGTAFNRAKADLLIRSPIEEVTLLRDNDPAGRAWRNRIVAELCGKIDVKMALVPTVYKDVNEWAIGVGGPSNVRLRSRFLRSIKRFQLNC